MRKEKLKRLRYEDWPQLDRDLWEAIFSPVDIFDDGVTGSHLSLSSRRGLQFAYGRFLGFLHRHEPETLSLTPDQRVSRGIIAEYVSELKETCTDASVATELHHFRLALKLIAASTDWSWLHAIQKRFFAKVLRQTKKFCFITSDILYELGIQLMSRAHSEAETAGKISKAHALMYRDGLIIAFLAAIPLRRRTLTTLQIGEHVVRSGNRWSLHIPARDMKTRRSLDFSLSEDLSCRIDLYIDRYRKRFPGAAVHVGLWASNKARAMDHGAIYNAVCSRTHKAFGFFVGLHQFRRAAGTFWSINDPARVQGVKDLLGHSSFETTEIHYIKAQSRHAGRVLADSIRTQPLPPERY